MAYMRTAWLTFVVAAFLLPSVADAQVLEAIPEAAEIAPGDTFRVVVGATSVQDLFGLSFELVASSGAQVAFLSSSAHADFGTDLLFLSQYMQESSVDADTAAVGVSRKQGASGHDGAVDITTLTLRLLPGAVAGTTISFSLQDVTATDPNGAAVTLSLQTSSITVMNLPPQAVDDASQADKNAAVTIDVTANDTDPEGDLLSVTAVTDPAHGAAAITQTSTSVAYTPDADFTGTDTFTYTVSDGQGNTGQAKVTVAVANQPPVLDNPVADQSLSVGVDVFIVELENAFSDSNGDSLAYAVMSSDTSIVTAETSGSTLETTPQAEGQAVITVTATDGSADAEDTFLVTVSDTRVNVWPGDTNNDGLVEEADVLPLGLYYGNTGPARGADAVFAGVLVLPWNTPAATYADADGSGGINEQDLLPIGQHFGKSHGQATALSAREPAIRLRLPALSQGAEVILRLEAAKALEGLLGVSFDLQVPRVLTLIDTEPVGLLTQRGAPGADAASPAHEGLLEIQRFNEGRLSAAFTRFRGEDTDAMAGARLVEVRLRAEQSVKQPVDIVLYEATTSRSGAGLAANTLALTSPQAAVPEAFSLGTNYPNPFAGHTTIAFALPEEADVTLEVYDVLGRRVTTLIGGIKRPAGQYDVPFDAAGLAGGTYFYRLTAGNYTSVRSMLLIK